MRVVFFGHVRYSVGLLERLWRLPGVEIAGVVTRRAGAAHADFSSLAPLAAEIGVPCLLADEVAETGWAAWLRERRAHVGYAMGWSTILRRHVLDVFPHGIVGYHPAALPRNRGHHPIIWALALGLKETASTLFVLDEGVDSGDIVSQQALPIQPDDDAGTLYAKLAGIVAQQMEQVTADLLGGHLTRVRQNHARSSVWRRRGYADGKIDWRMSAANIHNLVRALTRPYVGAHCVVDGRDVKVWRTRVCVPAEAPRDLEPGRVLRAEAGSFVVKCGEGELQVVDHELERLPRVGACLQ